MGQVVFKLPPVSKSKRARPFVVEGFHANEHCKGRGDNPYAQKDWTRRAEWWDQGWCECQMLSASDPQEEEIWLAGTNE